jgi:chorismate-pyruvate lyase
MASHTTNSPSSSPKPSLDVLVGLFFFDVEELGQFEQVEAQDIPESYRKLLAHNAHMTVAVEDFHQSPVDVQVLETSTTQSQYARQILLTKQSDGRTVQWGIMRVSFSCLPESVRNEIEQAGTPLGRILITHDVHRQVRLSALWRATPGPTLAKHLGSDTVYGRTAIIEVDGEPAIELLEIVTAD